MTDSTGFEFTVETETTPQPEVTPEAPFGYCVDGTPRKRRKLEPEQRKPQVRTVAERRAAALKRSKEIAAERKARIPVRLGLSLEMFEGLVTIAERIGSAKVASVAVRAMAMGMTQWARELKIALEAVPDEPLTPFERIPAVAAPQTYGRDEVRVREELREMAEHNAAAERERDGIANQLHLPGRKRAFG